MLVCEDEHAVLQHIVRCVMSHRLDRQRQRNESEKEKEREREKEREVEIEGEKK